MLADLFASRRKCKNGMIYIDTVKKYACIACENTYASRHGGRIEKSDVKTCEKDHARKHANVIHARKYGGTICRKDCKSCSQNMHENMPAYNMNAGRPDCKTCSHKGHV